MKTRHISLISVLAFFMLITLSACTMEANNYPLEVDDGGSGKSTKWVSKAGECFTLGILFISNKGDKAISIDRVSLLDVTNMTVLETSLMIIGEEKGLIGFQPWPPTLFMNECPNFDKRIPAAGAEIGPGCGYNLIVAVQLLEDKAFASGLEIDYQDGSGKHYVEKSFYAYEFDNDGVEDETSVIR